MTNRKHGTVYVGVTSQLIQRVYQHKIGAVEGFTKKYNTKLLVYFEEYNNVLDALQREKQLKNWKREWKLDLIEKENPGWSDLYEKLF